MQFIKTISLIFILTFSSVSKPSNISQYTESECLLLKSQENDYKRRLGTNNQLYLKSKYQVETYCHQPKVVNKTKENIAVLTAKNTQQTNIPISTINIVNQPKAPLTTQPHQLISNVFLNSFTQLWPMFLLLILGLFGLGYLKRKLPVIKGKVGESYVKKGLVSALDSRQYTVINDVTLPLEDGGTTQIDHIVVSHFGIFVLETKNMSGWIFGSEHQVNWTQTLHRKKCSFQNPLRQNYKHTKTLAYLLELPHELFHSIVVFTNNAELKTNMPNNVGHFYDMLAYIKSFNDEIIDHKLKLRILKLIDIIRLAEGRKTNRQHVQYLKK